MARINHEKIARHAKDNRWNATNISNATGGAISISAVLNILKGQTANPTVTNLKTVCDVIGLAIEDVFIETEERAAA